MSENENNGFDRAIMGEGATTIAVGVERGQVMLRFPKEVAWVLLDPETARQVAEAIGRAAYEGHYGRPPPTGKSIVGDEKRQMLVQRLSLMLGSFARQPKMPSNGAMATQLVDTVLAEVI